MKLKSMMVALVLLIVGLWAATQYAAGRIGESDEYWFSIHGWAIYAPWSLIVWQMKSPHSIMLDRAMDSFLIYAALVTGLFALAARSTSPKVKAFGTEGWGNRRDMKKAGLLHGCGTVIGIHRGRLLTYNGPEHQLVSGASRSGKGVGHVVPTLLCWPESALVYDVKSELWDLTAGYRSKYQHCLLFNPIKLNSAHFNPLLEIRKGPHEIRDVQNLVEMLVNPDGSKRTLDVWDQNAFQFLTALVLHVLYAEPEHKHLGRVRELLLDFENTCAAMVTTPHRLNPQTKTPEVYPEVARVAKSLLNQAERFRSSVRGTAESYLTLWADDVICEVTSRSDFVAGDLMCLEKPVTLYLQPPPSDLARVRPLVRLVLNQLARALMEQREFDARNRRKHHRLLLMLDEFPTLGRLDFFVMNLRQMAGYGLKAHLIVQSFNDIIEHYGPHNTIIDNCHVLVCFASADTITQQRISQMTGEAVEYRDSYSKPRSLFAMDRRSVSQSEHVRPLLNPGQIRMFPQEEQLIFVTGFKPFRTRKLRYYQHPPLAERIVAAPDPPPMLPKEVMIAHDWEHERAKRPRLPMPQGLHGAPNEQNAAALPSGDEGVLDEPEHETESGGYF